MFPFPDARTSLILRSQVMPAAPASRSSVTLSAGMENVSSELGGPLLDRVIYALNVDANFKPMASILQ